MRGAGDALAAGLPEDEHAAGGRTLETEYEAEQRRLASPVRARDRDELACVHAERDVVENENAGPVAERDSLELDNGSYIWHPSAFWRAARFDRMTVK